MKALSRRRLIGIVVALFRENISLLNAGVGVYVDFEGVRMHINGDDRPSQSIW